jgi:hypothetical protein
MPAENVNNTHIQKDTRETLSSINNVGIIETKELASPWAYTPENGLLPEIFRIQDKMKEYPVIRSTNPPKFIYVWLVPVINHNGRCQKAQITPRIMFAIHIPNLFSSMGRA